MNELKLQLLGRPQVWLGEELVTAFSSDKVLALLAYLVAVGQPVSRTAVEGLLWGESDRERAQMSLRTAVYNLNKQLPGYITTTRKTISLDPDHPLTADFLQLETALAQEDLATAVSHYHGDFLSGLYFDDCPEFENWLLRRRESLRQRIITALEQLLQQTLDPATRITYGRQLIEIEPWHEAAHRHLMCLLAQQGHIPSALALYETLKETLATELGVAPLPNTAVLAQRLRALQKRPARHNLPPALTPRYGRTAELDQLAHLLRDPAHRLITLTGLGGSGKTTLALSAARQHQADFLEGACFVSLADLPATATADHLLTHISHRLTQLRLIPASLLMEGNPAGDSDWVQALQGLEFLLVLDNLEHVQDTAVPLIIRLLQETNLTLLVTSRRRLNMAAETVLDVAGLAYPPAKATDWQSYPAVQLFQAVATRVWSGFQLTEADRTAVVQICERLVGLPLALELAAACSADQSCTAVAADLSRSLDALQSDQPDRLDRHRSLRAVFAYAWQHLSPDLQAILPQLAIFPGAFSRPAATAVSRATSQQLSQLAAHALLQRTGRDGYEVHSLIREYAAEQKTDTAVGDRFTRYFASEATRLMALMPTDQSTAWEELLRQESNLRAAWALALSPADPARLEPLGEALAFLYAESGEFRRGLALFDTAVGHLNLADPFSDPPLGWDALPLARLLLAYSRFLFYTQQHGRARQLIQTLLPVLRRNGTPAEVALALRGLSLTASDPDETVAYELESLALFRQAGEPWQVARSLINLAVVEGHRGDYQQANARHDEAIALLRQLGDQLELARALEYRGELARLVGDYPLALALMQESLRLCRTNEDRDGLQRVLFNLGWTHLVAGELAPAEALFQERYDLWADEASGEADAGAPLMQSLLGLSQVALLRGGAGTAVAAALIQQANTAVYTAEPAAFLHLGLGDVALASGDAAQAVTAYETSWQLFVGLEQVARALGVRARLGWALGRVGQAAEARAHWRAVLAESLAYGLLPTALTAVAGLAGLDADTAVLTAIATHPATDSWTAQMIRT